MNVTTPDTVPMVIFRACATCVVARKSSKRNVKRTLRCLFLIGHIDDISTEIFLTISIAKVNRSECDHLLLIPTNGGEGTVINRQRPLAVKAKSSTCFALRGERFASSSRLMGLSLLGYKDGTRTIEMILVSTVLKSQVVYWNDRLKVNILYMWERLMNKVNTHAQ